MPSFFLLTLDLTSRGNFTPNSLNDIKDQISSLEEEIPLGNLVLEILDLTKEGRIEIYAEDTGILISSGEEILSSIKVLEGIMGEFSSGSCFEIGKDSPGSSEKWIRSGYSWEVEDPLEDEKSWEEDSYWGEEWEEWKEEWD